MVEPEKEAWYRQIQDLVQAEQEALFERLRSGGSPFGSGQLPQQPPMRRPDHVAPPLPPWMQ